MTHGALRESNIPAEGLKMPSQMENDNG